MPALPWTTTSAPEPDREYLVLASHLPLARLSATPRFFRFVGQIRKQLATADGLVGYSLDAHPVARSYWTLSAWEGREALDRFVQSTRHVDVMAALKPVMGATRFATWTVPGADLPVRWQDAKVRVEAG